MMSSPFSRQPIQRQDVRVAQYEQPCLSLVPDEQAEGSLGLHSCVPDAAARHRRPDAAPRTLALSRPIGLTSVLKLPRPGMSHSTRHQFLHLSPRFLFGRQRRRWRARRLLQPHFVRRADGKTLNRPRADPLLVLFLEGPHPARSDRAERRRSRLSGMFAARAFRNDLERELELLARVLMHPSPSVRPARELRGRISAPVPRAEIARRFNRRL